MNLDDWTYPEVLALVLLIWFSIGLLCLWALSVILAGIDEGITVEDEEQEFN
jgi:hypothetical protein